MGESTGWNATSKWLAKRSSAGCGNGRVTKTLGFMSPKYLQLNSAVIHNTAREEPSTRPMSHFEFKTLIKQEVTTPPERFFSYQVNLLTPANEYYTELHGEDFKPKEVRKRAGRWNAPGL